MSPIDLTNFCNDKGYDVAPLKAKGGVKVAVYFKDKLLKKGETVFKDWISAQKETYNKIYNKLTK